MEALTDKLNRNGGSFGSMLPRRQPPEGAPFITQTRSGFQQNLGTTKYKSTSTKPKGRDNMKATEPVVLSSSRKSDHMDDGEEYVEADSLNLGPGSMPIGTPAKPVSDSSFQTMFAPRSYPSFKKNKARSSSQDKNKNNIPEMDFFSHSPPPPSSSSRSTLRSSTLNNVDVYTHHEYDTHMSREATPKAMEPKRNLYSSLGVDDTPRGNKRSGSSESALDTVKPFPMKKEPARSRSNEAHDESTTTRTSASGVKPTKIQPHPTLKGRQKNAHGKQTTTGVSDSGTRIGSTKKGDLDPHPFPMLKSVTKKKGKLKLSENKRSSSSDDSSTPPPERNAKKVKTVPQPFPMAIDLLAKRDQLKPPSTMSVSSSSVLTEFNDEDSEVRRKRIESALAMTEGMQINTFVVEDVDPSMLCPYCDQAFPSKPSALLESMLERAHTCSYRDPRPSNPKGLKAPILVYVDLCQRHNFETEQLPLARSRGWPTKIAFENVPRRIQRLRSALQNIVMNRETSSFWVELSEEIKQAGSRKVTGIAGQFVAFDKSQPGYYGEQGSLIMTQTLYSMFPLEKFDPGLAAPLTPAEFIQRILVPEAALSLIMDDMNLDRDTALETLRESNRYGVAMFPSLDKPRVDENTAKEKTASRKKGSEAEEVHEKEIQKNKSNARRIPASKGKGKGKSVGSDCMTDNEGPSRVCGSTAGSDVSRTSRKSTLVSLQRKSVDDNGSTKKTFFPSSPVSPARTTGSQRSKHNVSRATRHIPDEEIGISGIYVSDSEPDAKIEATPKPRLRKRAIGEAPVKNNPPMRPLEMAKAKQSGGLKPSRGLQRQLTSDNHSTVKGYTSISDDDSEDMEISQGRDIDRSKQPRPLARNTKSKAGSRWLLSSSQDG